MTAATAVLARGSRLRSGRQIVLASRHGARARVEDLSVSLWCGPDRSEMPRAAVVVGRRVGGAVVRNRLRRRLQHAVAELLPELSGGAQMVVRGGQGLIDRGPDDLRRDLRQAFQRARDRSARRPYAAPEAR